MAPAAPGPADAPPLLNPLPPPPSVESNSSAAPQVVPLATGRSEAAAGANNSATETATGKRGKKNESGEVSPSGLLAWTKAALIPESTAARVVLGTAAAAAVAAVGVQILAARGRNK
jgi:hypothetical protein